MYWYDGRFCSEVSSDDVLASSPFNDAGLRFGASVFTTMRVHGQDLEHRRSQFSTHCDRLTHSIKAFNWDLPDWPSIHKGCSQLAAHYSVIRITVFSDGTEWITGRSLPTQLFTQQQTGITGWLAPPTYARSLPTHKTGNYLACWLARQAAQNHGAQAAVLTNERGDWLETATGNLWGWKSGQWYTPIGKSIGNQCLPGLMRDYLVQVLSQEGASVCIQPWDDALARSFDAIAYSNCVVELIPIHTILNERTTLKYNSQHESLKWLRQRLASFAECCDDS
ncbi:MAG: aminotransferase class IV [Cyanobacteria bacterium J06560_2]